MEVAFQTHLLSSSGKLNFKRGMFESSLFCLHPAHVNDISLTLAPALISSSSLMIGPVDLYFYLSWFSHLENRANKKDEKCVCVLWSRPIRTFPDGEARERRWNVSNKWVNLNTKLEKCQINLFDCHIFTDVDAASLDSRGITSNQENHSGDKMFSSEMRRGE